MQRQESEAAWEQSINVFLPFNNLNKSIDTSLEGWVDPPETQFVGICSYGDRSVYRILLPVFPLLSHKFGPKLKFWILIAIFGSRIIFRVRIKSILYDRVDLYTLRIKHSLQNTLPHCSITTFHCRPTALHPSQKALVYSIWQMHRTGSECVRVVRDKIRLVSIFGKLSCHCSTRLNSQHTVLSAS